MNKIEWTASNNSSFLVGPRDAKTIRAAVRDARRYVDYELYGDGKITFFEDGEIIRIDEKNMFTGHKWQTNLF